jgi:ribonuclease HII
MLDSCFIKDGKYEAGCDEAGRGCLAGPVVAAAVILPEDFYHPLLNDSKQLSAKQRNILRPIIEKEAIAYSVSKVFPKMIDKINILNASFRAMHLSVEKLSINPHRLLIDGNRFKPYKKYEHHCIIKGDGKYASIAAASILAKEYRDDYMLKISRKFPHYGWQNNKGYPTEEHRCAIKDHGPCEYHRRSFRLYPQGKQGSLF